MIRSALLALAFFLAACEMPVEAPLESAGVPMMPPPPCWDEAGNPLPDDVCAERAGLTEPDSAPIQAEDDGLLPGPPSMPD